jgi:hypothetical protein
VWFIKWLREAYDWAHFLHAAGDVLQHWLGVSVMTSLAAMLSGAALNAGGYQIAIMGVFALIAVNIFGIARAIKKNKPGFEFVFDESDPRFVRRELNRIVYRIGLRVLAPHTVDSISIRALDSSFTERVIAPSGLTLTLASLV